MGKLSNVLTLLELLSTGRKYTINELAEKLEVTPRMIRVYKDELELAGIYVETIRGQYGGYVLDNKQLIPKRGFSKYDIALLENVYSLVNGDCEFELNHEFLNLISKIKGIYGISKMTNNESISDSELNKDKYNLFNKAIKQKQKMEILFLSASGEKNVRTIHPCDMFLYGGNWYVSAFCELRCEIRHFRLERILEYKLLNEKY